MEEKDTKKNAPQGKGKGKKKQITIPLNDFVNSGDTQQPAGFKTVSTRWSDVMDDEDIDSNDYGGKNKDFVILPTAPKSVRGPDIDISQVPTEPPFKCYLSNLPFEVTEDEVRRFFKDLEVKHIDLQRGDSGGRGMRGQGKGTCEFYDRQSLIDAFTLNQEPIKNRPIKLSLRAYGDYDRNERYGNRDRGNDDREDRTAGDWRAGKPDFKPPMNNFSSNRPYSDSNNQSFGGQNRNRDYNSQRNYGADSSSFGNNDRSNYGSSNYNRQRMDRNYNNSYSNPTNPDQNQSRNSSNPNYDYNAFPRKDDEPFDDKPAAERPRLVLNPRSIPKPELDLPPPQQLNQEGPSSQSQSRNLSESDSLSDDRNLSRYASTNNPSLNSDQSQEPEKPIERRKLQLKPRSKKENAEPTEQTDVKPASSIFGEARPVDTTKRLLEIETKVQQHDQEIEKELSEKLEKQPISESSDGPPSRENRRDLNSNKRSDSHTGGGGGHYRDGGNRFDDGGYRKSGPRRINQQPGGDRNYNGNNNNYQNNNNYRDNNRDGGNYRVNKFTNNNNSRNMNNDHMDNHRRQDYDDQRPNRMANQQRNNNRQNQENLQTNLNRFDVLGADMD